MKKVCIVMGIVLAAAAVAFLLCRKKKGENA